MKKIYLLMSVIFTLSSFFSGAAEVKSDLASQIAKNYYWQHSVGVNNLEYEHIDTYLVHTAYSDNAPAYFVYNINFRDGFVIVSAEDATLPVLGISHSGNYIPGQEPPALLNLLKHYKEQIEFARSENLTPDAATASLWSSYTVQGSDPEPDRGVSPLIGSMWNQDCWYNEQCPVDAGGPCGHVWAGCGAVAMAQHMKYYQHPATGTGSHSYTHATYGLQSANFGATTYDYSLMPNSITASNAYIAQLMYHCGVAVDMDYGPSGSACWNTAIDAALINYFGYSSSAAWDWRANHTDAQWIAKVKAELDNGNPLIYYGNDNVSGHFFNCDGYNDSDQLHMNWGWSGAYNGYFTITNLVPLAGYNFTYNQGAIFNATPVISSLYCSASGGCQGLWIKQVQLNTINNSSNHCDNYTDYSSSISTQLEAGGEYTMRVIADYATSTVAATVNCRIDWNQDLDFDDAGESYNLPLAYNFTSGITDALGAYQGNISVPAGATLGKTIMRVRVNLSTVTNLACGDTDDGEVEDYGITVSGDAPPPAATLPFVFSVDIGADTELSDPQGDGDEVFDPGDAYLYSGVSLPSGGADGLINDAKMFNADPWPIPGTAGTGAPVGNGGELPSASFFDMDGLDQIMSVLSTMDFGPGLPPLPQFTDPLVYDPAYLLISYDDDESNNFTYTPGSVPVNSLSPAGNLYGTNTGKDEVVQSDFPMVNTLPRTSSYTGNVTEEVPLHFNLSPDPASDNIPDDDVDALDTWDSQSSPNAHIYFSPDHEALFVDPNSSLKLEAGNIYQSPPGGGTFLEVINGAIHMGLPLKTDVDAFEFTWLHNSEFGYMALAVLFSVDDDDPLTLNEDESGGLDPAKIYCSFLDGSYQEFSDAGMGDDIDAITITPTSYTVNPNLPDAGFGSDLNLIPKGSSVTFTDQSTGNPTSWQWSFPGGTPSSYTGQVPPPVYYNAAGVYNVSLTVSNASGTDTETKTGYIDVRDYPTGWEFTKTATSHLISVPAGITFVNNPMTAGDFFGVFYIDENGDEQCGGANIWDSTNNKVVVAFGDDMTTTPLKEGFADGENFIWKVFYDAISTEKYAEVTYSPMLPNHDGKFHDNGLSALLTMNTDPLVVMASASPQEVCEGGEVQLGATPSGGTGTYTFSWTSDPPGFTSVEQNPLVYPAEDTRYYVTVDDGNSTKTDSVDVTVAPMPTVNAGADATICENGFKILSGTASNYSAVSWSTSGDGTINNGNSLNATYIPGPNDKANGSVVLTLSATALTPCTGSMSDDMVLTILSNPEADAGPDASVCESGSYTLANSSASNYQSLQWTTSGDGSFNNGSVLHPVYTPGAGDISNGSVVLTLTANPISPCGQQASSSMTLTFTPAPTANAGSDATICQGSTFSPVASATSFSGVAWATSGDGTFSNKFVIDPVYTPGAGDIANGSVTLTLKAMAINPCIGYNSDDLILTINAEPEANAGADANICENEDYQLQGIVNNACGQYWYTNGDGSFDNAALTNAVYTPGSGDIAAGSVELCLVAEPCDPCTTADTDCMIIEIQVAPSVDPLADVTICATQPTVCLDATVVNAGALSWTTSGDGTFDDTTLEDPCYTPGAGDIAAGTAELCIEAAPLTPCTVSATQCLSLTILQLPSAMAGNDVTICENETLTLSGQVENACNQHWYTNGDGTFDDTGLLNAVYTPGAADIAAGFAEICLVAEPCDPCTTAATDCLIITFQAAPVIDPLDDITICETQTHVCLSATVANAASILWSSTGDGTFDDSGTANPCYFPGALDLAMGEAELCITAQPIDPCTIAAVECLFLSFEPAPSAFAGVDATICEGEDVTLSGVVQNTCGYYWYGNGDGTFGNTGLLNTTYQPGAGDLANGFFEICLVAEACDPCTTDDTHCISITVQPAPDIAPLDDITICETDIPVCVDATVENASTVLWTTSGDGTFDDTSIVDACYTPGTQDIETGSVEICITAEAIDPCLTSATECMVITIQPLPAITGIADATICAGGSFCATTVAENYASLLWSTTGDGTFDDPAVADACYTPGTADLFNGNADLCLTAEPLDPCAVAAVECMTLYITPQPVIQPVDDASICEGDILCIGATAENYSTLAWTTSGDGTFDDATLEDPCYTPGSLDIANGTAELCLTAEPLDPCTAFATECLILNIQKAPLALAGDDAVICENETLTLNGSVENACGFSWSTLGDGTFDDPALLTAVYTPGAGDLANGSAEICLTAEPCDPCTVASTDCLTLTIQPQATLATMEDVTICADMIPYCIDATAADYASLTWFTSGDGAFDNSSIEDPCYTPGAGDLATGTVELCLSAESIDPCTVAAQECFMLNIQPLPLSNAGADAVVCEDGTYQLIGSVENACNFYWYSTGDGTFDDSGMLAAIYTPGAQDLSNGTVEICLVAEACDPCSTAATDCMQLDIQYLPEAYAGNDVTIGEGGFYTLVNATAGNYSSLLWTTAGDGNFDNPSLLQATYTPGTDDTGNGLVELCLTAQPLDPCTVAATDCMTIYIEVAPVAYAGPDQTVCEGGSASLTAATADNFLSLEWTTTGDGTFDNANLLNPVYTPGAGDISNGTVQLCLNAYPVPPASITATDCMILTIRKAPSIAPLEDAVICEGETFCADATAANYGSLLWTTNGDGTFDDAALEDACYTPGAGDIALGVAELCLTAEPVDPCTVAAQECLTLTIQKAPVVQTLDDAAICAGDIFCPDATAVNYTNLLWTAGGDGAFDDATLEDPCYTPGNIDIETGSVELCLTAEPIDPCSFAAVECMTLIIQTPPSIAPLEDAIICEGETFCADATAANYGSLLWTTNGDGTFDDAALEDACYTAGAGDIALGVAELCLTAEPVDPCTIAAQECLTLTIGQVHQLEIPAGWSGISSFIEPFEADIETVMDPALEDLVIMYNLQNGIFAPGFNINTLNTWNSEDGYVIKLENAVTLNMCGNPLTGNSVELTEGWNLVPVPVDGNVAVADAVASISDELIIVKEVAGYLMYYPAYGITTLQAFEGGNAYFVKVNAACTLTFPEPALKLGLINPKPERRNVAPWNEVLPTPGSHIFVFTENALTGISDGDVIGAFDQEGMCAGWVEVSGSNPDQALVVNALDAYSESGPGMEIGEQISFRLFKPATGEDLELETDEFLFIEHGISVVKSSQVNNVSVAESQQPTIFPNPTQGEVNIYFAGDANAGFSIELLDIYGGHIRDYENNRGEIRLNLSEFPVGVYLLKITRNNISYTEKLVIK